MTDYHVTVSSDSMQYRSVWLAMARNPMSAVAKIAKEVGKEKPLRGATDITITAVAPYHS
jgi:hypothetical protein